MTLKTHHPSITPLLLLTVLFTLCFFLGSTAPASANHSPHKQIQHSTQPPPPDFINNLNNYEKRVASVFKLGIAASVLALITYFIKRRSRTFRLCMLLTIVMAMFLSYTVYNSAKEYEEMATNSNLLDPSFGR